MSIEILEELSEDLVCDLERLVRCNMKSLYDEIQWNGVGYDIETKKAELQQCGLTYIAKSPGNAYLLGFLKLCYVDHNSLWIMELQTSKQRMGIGSALLREVVADYGKKFTLGLAVQKNNAAVIAFYEKFGFITNYEDHEVIELTRAAR